MLLKAIYYLYQLHLMLNIFNTTMLVPQSLNFVVLLLKVKYEIFSNSVFICCSVLSSILTVLLFSNPYLKKQSASRNCKVMQSVKIKVVSIYISHLLSIVLHRLQITAHLYFLKNSVQYVL